MAGASYIDWFLRLLDASANPRDRGPQPAPTRMAWFEVFLNAFLSGPQTSRSADAGERQRAGEATLKSRAEAEPMTESAATSEPAQESSGYARPAPAAEQQEQQQQQARYRTEGS